MIKYKKYCPGCGDVIYFVSKYNLKKSIDKDSKCRKCYMLDEDVRKKLSLHCGKYGKKNGMYGKKHYYIDGYDIDKNVAIEIDENFHKYQENKDIKRQNEIQRILKCQFIRLSFKERTNA